MRHAKYTDFVKIQTLSFSWCSQQEIASYIWMSQSTVSRILSRIKGNIWAHELETERKEKRRLANRSVHQRIEPWWEFERYILFRIRTYQDSPDQIAGRWRKERWEALSKDTVYSFVYSHHPDLIKTFFRRKGKKYRNRRQEKVYQKYQLDGRRMIDCRPEYIEHRKQVWHWEWDTIIGKRWVGKEVIATNVERKSGYLLARVCQDKWSQQMYEKTVDMFRDIPQRKKKTNTYDNGREFALHRRIEWKTGIAIYFAHTYCSWERWTNENTNGLLRQYYPKWSSFSSITEDQLQQTVKKLNSRPRKRLNYKTPEEVFWWKRRTLTRICSLD